MVFPQGIFPHLHCQTTTHNIMINYYSMFNNDTCPRSLILCHKDLEHNTFNMFKKVRIYKQAIYNPVCF